MHPHSSENRPSPATLPPLSPRRLHEQMTFIAEIDRLKTVLRRNPLADASRRENTAEHSWHIATLAIVLAEYANEPIDVLHVVKMLLIHDVVEIDAGDTFTYDAAANADKEERERAAADRLFALLPDNQAEEYRRLWNEFEARVTPDSKFANALDRLQPLLLNYLSGGGTWKEYDVPWERIMDRVKPIADGSHALWDAARALLDDGVHKGRLRKDT